MAVIKRIASKATPNKIVSYLTKEEKTQEQLISGKDCTPEYVLDEFKATKELYNQNKGVMYHHIVQSFSPEDNIKPDKAHELGKELAEKQFTDHEVLVVTHIDKDHIHNHLVVNSVNFENGKKYKSSNKSLWDIKRESNKQCERENLKTLDLDKKATERVTSGELRLILKGQTSWKDELRQCIDLAKDKTKNIDELSKYLKNNFDIDTRITNKTISYKHPEKEKAIRGSRLGTNFDKEEIESGFIRKEKEINRARQGQGEPRTITREETGGRDQLQGVKRDISRDNRTQSIDEIVYKRTNGQGSNYKSNNHERDRSHGADININSRQDDGFIERARQHVEQQARNNATNVSRVLQPDSRTRAETDRKARRERIETDRKTRETKQSNSREYERRLKHSKTKHRGLER